ncbi:MAG: DnaB-like helicase C-terminal domain-containing protein [Minisyncoccia bacterium]
MADKLSNFGHSFQVKVISALLTDKAFTQQVSDILLPDFFESEANVWIVDTIIKYFYEYKTAPTLDVFKIKVQDISSDVLKTSIIEMLKDAFRYLESEDLDFIKEQTLDFCKNQCIKRAILDSVELLNKGQYDAIKSTIDIAMKAGADKEVGHEYNESVQDRYKDNVRSTIATPWPVINDLSDGGFGKGELVVFVAPAGIGKSWGLINVGAHAVKQGLNVVHYTLELNEGYVGQRYDAVLTGIANQNLKFNLDEVESTVSKLKGNLVIKYYPTKTASCSTIRAHIENMILIGKKPDIVIVDYADLLRGAVSRKEMRHELESIYEDLRGIAGEYEVPLYTASQANRSALEMDVIEADKISESYSKIMIADFVLSLSRKVTDKIAGTGRWHIIKNRFGPDGLTLPSKMNMSNGQIHIYEETSVEGKETKTSMQTGEELLKKSLSQKYKEIQGNTFG